MLLICGWLSRLFVCTLLIYMYDIIEWKIFPELNWRDLQHLVIRTSRPKGILKAADWSTNGVGLQYSHSYGYGLMDAGHMVKLAKNWETVPDQLNCTTEPEIPSPEVATIPPQSDKVYELDASECGSIKHLEHIQLHIELTSQARRGDLSVHLLSPLGTHSVLLAERPFDQLRTGSHALSVANVQFSHALSRSLLLNTLLRE